MAADLVGQAGQKADTKKKGAHDCARGMFSQQIDEPGDDGDNRRRQDDVEVAFSIAKPEQHGETEAGPFLEVPAIENNQATGDTGKKRNREDPAEEQIDGVFERQTCKSGEARNEKVDAGVVAVSSLEIHSPVEGYERDVRMAIACKGVLELQVPVGHHANPGGRQICQVDLVGAVECGAGRVGVLAAEARRVGRLGSGARSLGVRAMRKTEGGTLALASG